MPIFHVNFNTKPGSQALGNLQRNGNELVKAMQLKDIADSQQSGGGNAITATSAGANQGHDVFKNQMLDIQGNIEGYNETSRQLSEGNKLLESVNKMVSNPTTGVLGKIRRMQELWLSITQTGRELENDDLHKIFKIRKDIEDVMAQFAGLRYNGISVFARKVNIESSSNISLPFSNANSSNSINRRVGGSFDNSGASGANIDFVRHYEDIRQNLNYIQENISSYARKQEVTRNFQNAERSAMAILRESDTKKEKFNNLANNVFYAKRRALNKRDQVIRERQNQLSVEAVVGILERQNGVNLGN
tara:strand:- start:975 stop:1886 length:912 start_codon:yes stop_codon:yes gene_type:complete